MDPPALTGGRAADAFDRQLSLLSLLAFACSAPGDTPTPSVSPEATHVAINEIPGIAYNMHWAQCPCPMICCMGPWMRETRTSTAHQPVSGTADTHGALMVDKAGPLPERSPAAGSGMWRLLVVLAVLAVVVACGDSGDGAGTEAVAVAVLEGAAEPDTAAESDPESGSAAGGSDVVDAVVDAGGGDLLGVVKQRGRLVCGVSGTRVIFSQTQPDGSVFGVDADYCRVVAAVLFGDADAVEFVSLTTGERFVALQSGLIDVLIRSTTWTQSRDIEVGLDFGPVIYYDGQQLMARAADGYSPSAQVADIAGAVVCALAGTTTEQNISDAADAAGIEITVATYEDFDTITENFIQGACDVVTADGSALAGRKAKQQPADQRWVIFPATPISKEPLAPVYQQNQSRFGDVVNWAVYATIIADEKGITSANAAEMAASPPDAEARRLLGGDGELQTAMGLAPDAFLQAISQVGNYGEILGRHLEPAGLTRAGTVNASWRDGGLIYAPPAR